MAFKNFLWLSNIPLCFSIHHIFIHSSADGHLDYFCVLAIEKWCSQQHFGLENEFFFLEDYPIRCRTFTTIAGFCQVDANK